MHLIFTKAWRITKKEAYTEDRTSTGRFIRDEPKRFHPEPMNENETEQI